MYKHGVNDDDDNDVRDVVVYTLDVSKWFAWHISWVIASVFGGCWALLIEHIIFFYWESPNW